MQEVSNAIDNIYTALNQKDEELGTNLVTAILDGIANEEINFASLFEGMGPGIRETF
jgi:hypothetical protein